MSLLTVSNQLARHDISMIEKVENVTFIDVKHFKPLQTKIRERN